jgi:hypothetical protein
MVSARACWCLGLSSHSLLSGGSEFRPPCFLPPPSKLGVGATGVAGAPGAPEVASRAAADLLGATLSTLGCLREGPGVSDRTGVVVPVLLPVAPSCSICTRWAAAAAAPAGADPDPAGVCGVGPGGGAVAAASSSFTTCLACICSTTPVSSLSQLGTSLCSVQVPHLSPR